MLKKHIDNYVLLVNGLLMALFGILLLVKKEVFLKQFLLFLCLGLITIASLKLIILIFKHDKKKILTNLSISLVNILFGFILMFADNLIFKSVALVYQIYLFLIVLSHIINFGIYRKYKIKGKIKIIISIIFNIIFISILSVNQPKNISFFLGLYLLIYGVCKILNFVFITLAYDDNNKLYLPIPVLFTAFIPRRLLKLIGIKIKNNDDKEFDFNKNNKPSDIEVVIHLAKNGTSSFGHIEVAYKNKIYSYGNYDKHSRSLFGGIGDGVVLVADKDKYIKYCVMNKNRYIVVFGLTLSDKEKQIVEKRIKKLLTENTIDYYPDQQLYEQGRLESGNYVDMSSEIYKLANGKFKKITAGKHKKFFVLKTNCAMVANYILSSVDKKIVAINGIITPGTYYNYLNERLMLNKTNVISRKIYTREYYEPKLK